MVLPTLVVRQERWTVDVHDHPFLMENFVSSLIKESFHMLVSQFPVIAQPMRHPSPGGNSFQGLMPELDVLSWWILSREDKMGPGLSGTPSSPVFLINLSPPCSKDVG
jgi:hypothetical protein